MSARPREEAAFVFPAPPGRGGLGVLARDVIETLAASGREVHAVGPAAAPGWSVPAAVRWTTPPELVPSWAMRYTWLRWYQGQFVYLKMKRLGAWAAREVARTEPSLVYAFAEAGLETLRWAKARGIPTVLDNPTGDVRHYREACVREYERWGGERYRGHPTPAMVERTLEEYALADRIRVASTFSRRSMVERGVPAEKVEIVAYPCDVRRFHPPAAPRAATGPLRLCYVATLAFAKGYQYLLRAARLVGPSRVHVELVGGTDSRGSRRYFERERVGLDVRQGPVADLNEAYHRAELLVLPSLHDGYGFVVAEAMATGLPVIVTDACGAADLVRHGETGWIVPAGDERALAAAIEHALANRAGLAPMGEAARRLIQERGAGDPLDALFARPGLAAAV